MSAELYYTVNSVMQLSRRGARQGVEATADVMTLAAPQPSVVVRWPGNMAMRKAYKLHMLKQAWDTSYLVQTLHGELQVQESHFHKLKIL